MGHPVDSAGRVKRGSDLTHPGNNRLPFAMPMSWNKFYAILGKPTITVQFRKKCIISLISLKNAQKLQALSLLSVQEWQEKLQIYILHFPF